MIVSISGDADASHGAVILGSLVNAYPSTRGLVYGASPNDLRTAVDAARRAGISVPVSWNTESGFTTCSGTRGCTVEFLRYDYPPKHREIAWVVLFNVEGTISELEVGMADYYRPIQTAYVKEGAVYRWSANARDRQTRVRFADGPEVTLCPVGKVPADGMWELRLVKR